MTGESGAVPVSASGLCRCRSKSVHNVAASAGSSVAAQLAIRFSASWDGEPGSAVWTAIVRPASANNSSSKLRTRAPTTGDGNGGYCRIHGELASLGVNVAASTVWQILRVNGIDPAPRRAWPTWPQFLRSQAEVILACDFFSAGLPCGTQAYVLTVIGHATRHIRILGVTLYPTGEWTTQQARNLIMDLGGQAERMKFMIRDRGSDAPFPARGGVAETAARTGRS